MFNVIPASQPQALHDCKIRNQSLDSLTVVCLPGDDGGLEQQFYLEVFLENGQLYDNLSLSEPPVEFIVRNAPVATTLILVLYSANEKGHSSIVTISASTTLPQGRGSGLIKV